MCESHAELPEGAGNATALNLRFKILDLTAFAGGTPVQGVGDCGAAKSQVTPRFVIAAALQ